MYHLKTIKHEGVNKCADMEPIHKNTRKYHEIKRISTFVSSKTNSDNAKEKQIFTTFHNHLTVALT